jgi:hypothetical protein
MNTLRKLWLTVLCAAVLTSVLPAMAGPTWADVRGKAENSKAFTLTYDYKGTIDDKPGTATFQYTYNGPKDIKTVLTKCSVPSKKGAVLIYKGGDKVLANTGGGTIARNLDHKDVTGRMFHQSIWKMIFDQLPGKNPKSTKEWKNGGSKFIWSGYTIYANKAGDIVQTERKDGTTPETRKFKSISWK